MFSLRLVYEQQESSLQGNPVSVVGFEVLTAVSTKMTVFWVVAPCNLVEIYKRFKGPCCLHHQGCSTFNGRNEPTSSIRVVRNVRGPFPCLGHLHFGLPESPSSSWFVNDKQMYGL
jgi:hypothetical protein